MVRTFDINDFRGLELKERYAPDFEGESPFIHTDIALKYKLSPRIVEKDKLALHEGAKMFAPFVDVIPTEEALAYLGVTRVQLKPLLENLQSVRNPLIFVGFGGINNGVVYWLGKLCEMMNSVALLSKTIHVVDYDNIEPHNLPRWHFYSLSDERNKAKWFYEHNRIYRTVGRVEAYPEALTEELLIGIKSKVEEDAERNLMPIVIGAPDSGTRKILSNSEHCNYLFIGQYMQHLNMWVNPKFVAKSVDSYGGIWANAFPIITLKATLVVLGALRLLGRTLEKEDEKKLLSMNFSRFIKQHDPENKLRIIMDSYTWSPVDGYRVKG